MYEWFFYASLKTEEVIVMIQVDVSAQVRKDFGKGGARSLRRSGQTPAIMYGPKTEPLPLSVDTRAFTKTLLYLQRRNAVINLDIAGESGSDKRHVVIKELQVNPIQDSLEHADFYEISLDTPSVFPVPLKYRGKAAGVDMGGDMSITVNTVNLKGNPLDIPDFIEVDVSPLQTNESITCADLAVPDNVTLLEKPQRVCVAVSAPVVAE